MWGGDNTLDICEGCGEIVLDSLFRGSPIEEEGKLIKCNLGRLNMTLFDSAGEPL